MFRFPFRFSLFCRRSKENCRQNVKKTLLNRKMGKNQKVVFACVYLLSKHIGVRASSMRLSAHLGTVPSLMGDSPQLCRINLPQIDSNFHTIHLENLMPLGIMRAQLRAPLKPLNTTHCCDVRGVSGRPLNGPP